jgi:hypothetical protein
MTCRTCGTTSSRDLCHYCTRSVALLKAGRCVYCTLPFSRLDDLRTEGLCHECRVRHVSVSQGTRAVLKLASRARWRAVA